MAPAEQQPVDPAAELDAAVAQAIEACGGDPVDAVRALIVANSMIEQELAEVYAKASHGFLRGRRVPKRNAPAEKAEPAQKKPNSG
ncbi:enamine deaminase RidA (YjgF/YER057c/UK114 family) [Bradyrhizobium japonicum USDA 38]|uniref:hypothetical protein n=1 Tax=Bradyrhizobium japonicum TaxID=375 RepID=UPI000401FD01|nr:hypothetical protein [Bradyrhizobium japonicum]MCS3893294.1 enamine deaminase RidA (YjgF/YER057c/UK114 family) [Bradyrhizobium japonicum USDA 38]MCS3945808.1 enamine deaminase RidA (YjgF/YER057c/UK114 family) [Bradyrhizobium japonicum]